MEEKWVTEGAIARRPRGRRPTLLSLNDDLVILAADIRPQQAIVALIDLNGRFLAREVVPLVSDPKRAILKIIDCMESMRTKHADRSFEGVGLSMPGRVDPEIPAPDPCPQSQVGQLRREEPGRRNDAAAGGVSECGECELAL